MKKILLATFIFFLVSSCKTKDETESNLVVTIGPANQYVINAAMKSCEQEAKGDTETSIQKPAFQLRNFRYQWKSSSNSYEMIYLQMNFKSADLSSGKYECILTGDQLGFTLSPSPSTIAAGDEVTYVSGCSIRCGGISFKNTVRYSFITGTALIYGVEVTPDGEMLPVFTETDVSIQYENRNL